MTKIVKSEAKTHLMPASTIDEFCSTAERGAFSGLSVEKHKKAVP
jgi:hypothetical protein